MFSRSVNRSKIEVFESDPKVKGSECHRKIFPTDFDRSRPKLTVKFVFERSVGQTVGSQSVPIGSKDKRLRPLLKKFSGEILIDFGQCRANPSESRVVFTSSKMSTKCSPTNLGPWSYKRSVPLTCISLLELQSVVHFMTHSCTQLMWPSHFVPQDEGEHP